MDARLLKSRLTALPVELHDVWACYKQQQASYWVASEIDLSADVGHFAKLTAEERYYVEHVLAFFASADGLVMDNIQGNFVEEIQAREAKMAYSFQAAMEAVHCVTPETTIMTRTGCFPIGGLVGTRVGVWNGEAFSDVDIVQTSAASPIWRVELSNGMQLECTASHKWLVRTGPRAHPEMCKVERVETQELGVETVIAAWNTTVLDPSDPDEFQNPYTHGFFCGDGTYVNGYPFVHLHGVKKNLLPHLKVSSADTESASGRTGCYLTRCINKHKFVVPINYSKETKLRWLEGLLDADGCVKRSKSGATAIQLVSVNFDFLRDVQLLLTTLGVVCNVKKGVDAGDRMLPDGRGGSASYPCKATKVLYITCAAVRSLTQIGFAPKRLQTTLNDSLEQRKLVTVTSVTNTGRLSPTFCFNEPTRHTGTFNGIVTGQSEVYSQFIETLVRNKERRDALNDAVMKMPCIALKADWARKHMDRSRPFAERVLGFIIMERLFFSASFAAIFWIRKRGLMPGLSFANELISRDEGMHADLGVLLFNEYCLEAEKPSEEQIAQIVRDAVATEEDFVRESLPVRLIGMNADAMAQYVKFVADHLLTAIKQPKLFHAANPFEWMEMISLQGKSNFFERKVGEYAKAGVNAKSVEEQAQDNVFTLEADF